MSSVSEKEFSNRSLFVEKQLDKYNSLLLSGMTEAQAIQLLAPDLMSRFLHVCDKVTKHGPQVVTLSLPRAGVDPLFSRWDIAIDPVANPEYFINGTVGTSPFQCIAVDGKSEHDLLDGLIPPNSNAAIVLLRGIPSLVGVSYIVETIFTDDEIIKTPSTSQPRTEVELVVSNNIGSESGGEKIILDPIVLTAPGTSRYQCLLNAVMTGVVPDTLYGELTKSKPYGDTVVLSHKLHLILSVNVFPTTNTVQWHMIEDANIVERHDENSVADAISSIRAYLDSRNMVFPTA